LPKLLAIGGKGLHKCLYSTGGGLDGIETWASVRRDSLEEALRRETPRRAGVAIGADGLIVEVHPTPERAISDGAQSLDLAQFEKMMRELQPYVALWREARKEEAAAVAM